MKMLRLFPILHNFGGRVKNLRSVYSYNPMVQFVRINAVFHGHEP